MVVLSEDDRNLFSKFMGARNALSICDDMLEDMHRVLSNKEYSHATRLAAAKLLVQFGNPLEDCSRHPAANWVILTAMLDTDDVRHVATVVKAWMISFEKRRIGYSEDESMFLAALARMLLKKGIFLNEQLSLDATKILRRYLLLTFVIQCELEGCSKALEGAVQYVFKTTSTEERLVDFCLNELDPRLRGKYGILTIFVRDTTSLSHQDAAEAFIRAICSQLAKKLNSQPIANAAGSLIAALVARFPSSNDLRMLFVQNITHRLKCVRWNILRWFGRFESCRESYRFLQSLQDSIRKMFAPMTNEIWPPLIWEAEDVSCIDPRWDSEEAEDVLWEADRVLDAYINVSTVLHQRFRHNLEPHDPLIRAGLEWHIPDIRKNAFQLWTSCLGKGLDKPENARYLEKFILNNGASPHACLRRSVAAAAESCKMSSEGKIKWAELLRRVRQQEKIANEQRGMSYLPDELSGAELIPLPLAELAPKRLEEALRMSGSDHPKSCPAFPILYENLAKVGYDHRVFARYVIDLIDLIGSNNDAKTALDLISGAVTRCRLKVVVDHGCCVVDELLSKQHFDEHFFFLVEYRYCWAINNLMDQNIECRTLPLSRILWTVCQKYRDLLKIFFETCQETLDVKSLDARVHHRMLKTLKLFASKAECEMPTSFVEFLFWHCVDTQEHDDFLVRSAATIVFGFVVRHITKSRIVPAFQIVVGSRNFWNQVIRRCSSIACMPSLQRTLLLSFLSRLILGHNECYSSSVQLAIYSLLKALIGLLKKTRDIRQRRFCLEILVALSSGSTRAEMLRQLEEPHSDMSLISAPDCDYLAYFLRRFDDFTESVDSRVVPFDLLQSRYVQLIEMCRVEPLGEAMMKTGEIILNVEAHSAELALPAVAMALTQIAIRLKEMSFVDHPTRILLVFQCTSLLEHQWCSSRTASIISRIPVCLGLTEYYYDKSYVLQLLRKWEANDTGRGVDDC